MDEQQEVIQNFLIESNENLTQLDQDFVDLEQHPGDKALLSSITFLAATFSWGAAETPLGLDDKYKRLQIGRGIAYQKLEEEA